MGKSAGRMMLYHCICTLMTMIVTIQENLNDQCTITIDWPIFTTHVITKQSMVEINCSSWLLTNVLDQLDHSPDGGARSNLMVIHSVDDVSVWT